jgi:hypothetical protein
MIIYTHQRSKKRKPTAKQRQLAAEWEAIKLKHAITPVTKSKKSDTYVPSKPFVRETPHYPSLMTNGPDTCTKPIEGKRYTGTAMLGIGTLHKSNAVPIFSDEEAKDQATMRR